MRIPRFPSPLVWFPAAAILVAAPIVRAQSFVKVTDASNAIVTQGAAPAGSFVGASWVDVDGDHDLDLFISIVGLFRNDGGGLFTRLPSAFLSQGPNALGNSRADMDNDGDLD